MIRWAAFTLALYSALPALAAGLELRYEALERLIAQQMFTGDGRRYVHGSKASRCQYAYLETPHIGAENGRLRITAKFSGRSAVGLLGVCVGMGDSFDLTLLATPVARQGRGVRKALAQSFQRDFKIDVREQARKLLEQGPENATVRGELKDFELSGVSLTPDSVVLEVEFRLVVK
jgi:hypothetical protein